MKNGVISGFDMVIELTQNTCQNNITIRDSDNIVRKSERNCPINTHESDTESTWDEMAVDNKKSEEMLNNTLKIMEFSNYPLPKKKESSYENFL